jgi:hypothetical protein
VELTVGKKLAASPQSGHAVLKPALMKLRNSKPALAWTMSVLMLELHYNCQFSKDNNDLARPRGVLCKKNNAVSGVVEPTKLNHFKHLLTNVNP